MSALCMNRGIGMQILFAESRSLVFQVTDAGADYSTETYEVWLNGIYRLEYEIGRASCRERV